MQYRKDKYGNDISALGYGCMRFTQKAGHIDLSKAEREVCHAIENGINYFDTAYIYPGSEAALGEILHRNALRDQVYIATKLPHYLIKSTAGAEKYFTEQLRRLKTDHIDYYLLHMLTDSHTLAKLFELGLDKWLADKKASGQIRQIGFSYHGGSEEFCNLIDAYDWDFCQIQYNYMDEHSQAGKTGLDYAAERGIPVIIMEPLRGGKLANLPPSAAKMIAEHPSHRTPVDWALRWLWDQREVCCVLSGMNSLAMVEENIATACDATVGSMTNDEKDFLKNIVSEINQNIKVGCTGCRYCMPCPKGVDIPGTFAAYNRRYSEGWLASMKDYFMCTALRKNSSAASLCIGCGKCESHCPQHIPIRFELNAARKKLETFPYKVGRALVKIFKMYK